MKKFILSLAAIASTLTMMAEGYQVNTLNVKQEGMAHTGVSLKLGAESMMFNPAGMRHTEVVTRYVVIEEEILNLLFVLFGTGFGLINQATAITHFGIKDLARGKRFVTFNKIENVKRHLIVATPRHIDSAVIDYRRHYVALFTEHCRTIHLERCLSIEV